MDRYNVIGVMSGTSLDGLDICYSNFELQNDKKWCFQIINTLTAPFPKVLKNKLVSAKNSNALELALLHNELGNFIGTAIHQFLNKYDIPQSEVDFIASHGHTIFHRPELGLTTQIGNGANISSTTKLPVICDFRTTDVALNGQGAPLVPIGDQHLFTDYFYCINLGGIANISFEQNNENIAYDICPTNMVLNHLAKEFNLDYDDQGTISRLGKVDAPLLEKLNQLEYYKKAPPKSLGSEWVESTIFPLLDANDLSAKDKLSTFVEHISIQIANALDEKSEKVLLTGGGAFNTFLVERIMEKSENAFTIPDKQLVSFKEALIFSFLGVLRLRNEVNCLSSVTGAISNTTGGCIYRAF